MSATRAAQIARLKLIHLRWRITERLAEGAPGELLRHAGYRAVRDGQALIAATPAELAEMIEQAER